jgi:hypothetical protein
MLMRKTIRRSPYEQLDLFRPPPQRPTWMTLPKEIQQKVLQLLARLMSMAHSRSGAAAKEVGDE